MVDVVRHNLDLARLFCFVLFLFLGGRIHFASASPDRLRRISLFIGFTLFMHLATGITQRDAWPFSPYPLMRGTWSERWQYSKVVFMGVDGGGREWPVDPMAWSPLFPLVLQEWFISYYPTLSTAEREAALQFLFEKAEMSRRFADQGRRVGGERLLGPLTAPDWWLYHRHRDGSTQPLQRLRVYRELWFPTVRARDASAFQRHLIDEYVARR